MELLKNGNLCYCAGLLEININQSFKTLYIMKNINYPKILIGKNENEPIYLTPPSWDCGWYWSFGYLGNGNCHYHLRGLMNNTNLYDGMKKYFCNSLIIRDSQLWAFCELVKTAYDLKDIAEVYNRGGSHYSKNPCAELIKNESEVERINEVLLPAIFEEIYKILIPSLNNKEIDKKLCELILEGDTSAAVDFMNENKIHTDDLKNIEGITSHDYKVIHSMYWEKYHASKNIN